MKSTGWGARIKAMREERGWSQEQLAEIAGVSERTIQRLEQEEPARFDSLRALAAAFKLDVKDLLGSAKPIEKPQDEPQVSFLLRIRTGADLFKVVGGAHAGSFDHDELKEEKQGELVESFAKDDH